MITRENTLDDYIVKEMNGYLKRINLSEDDLWLDVGAHIGAFCNVIQDRVKKVVAFEPDEDNYSLLIKNSNPEKCKTFKKALVGNNDSKRKFYINLKKNKGTPNFSDIFFPNSILSQNMRVFLFTSTIP